MGAILRELESGREFVLDSGDVFFAGRSRDCAVTLTHNSVARHHVRIEYSGGGWHVTDMGSANGTAINGARVQRDEIRPGDVLAVGFVTLHFDHDGRPPRLALPATIAPARPPLPQSFEGLLTIFRAAAPSVDGAIVTARAGEALLRFCTEPARRDTLMAAYQLALESTWPVVRAVGAHGIAGLAAAEMLEGKKAGATIERLLDDPAAYVQSSAARALAQVDPLAAAPRLHARAQASLEGTDAHLAREAAAQLVDLGDHTLLHSLRVRAEAQLHDGGGSRARRDVAAAVLGEISVALEEGAIVRALASLLVDPEERIRLAAVRALVRSGRAEAVLALGAALNDSSATVFQEACRGLSAPESRDPRLAERLIEALRATPEADAPRRARYRRALEDVTGERRGPDPKAWT